MKTKPAKRKAFRTTILCGITLVCAVSYYSYAARVYDSHEFKNPAGANTHLFEKHKYTYDIFSLPSRMTYYLLPPDPVLPDVQYPLLVVLHGGTGKSYAAGFMAENYYKNRYPGYVLVPVAPVNHVWGDPYADIKPYKNALPYVADLVKIVSNSHPIDKGRVYVLGCSMGGGGSIVASLFYQDTFAAAVALGSYFVPRYLPKTFDTPLVIIHGAQDEDAPVESIRKTANIIKNAGAPVYYSEMTDRGHNCPAREFYPEGMWDWLYSQTKPRLRAQ